MFSHVDGAEAHVYMRMPPVVETIYTSVRILGHAWCGPQPQTYSKALLNALITPSGLFGDTM